MKKIPYIALFAFIAFTQGSFVFASADDERILNATDDQSIPGPFLSLPAAERYSRAEAVLKHFQAPTEKPAPSMLAPLSQLQSRDGAAKILSILDPKKQFGRFFSDDDAGIRAFLDRDSLKIEDSRAEFAIRGEPLRQTGLIEKFRRAARNNPQNLPLQGLKIAIDPGHMGGDLWDTRTGKFVKDKSGEKISEGMINLQAALLLEGEFRKLGATVALTHRKLAPVTTLPYDGLSLEEFGRQELRGESLSPWFDALLEKAPAGPSLYEAFAKSTPFKKLFSDTSKGNYFILRADLSARWEAVEAFSPDITLIIHFDATGPNTVSPVPLDGTKVYVVGTFDPPEFATQRSRQRFAKHLLDPEAWTSSLALGRFVVQKLKNELGIAYDKTGGGSSVEVEPGIFARNLGVSTALSGHAVTFIEVLHYDDPSEFRRLRDFKYKLTIDGVSTAYSERLVQVVNAIKFGVLGFVASHSR
jgi:N-acetylmuramoyl-L-alanine amidase